MLGRFPQGLKERREQVSWALTLTLTQAKQLELKARPPAAPLLSPCAGAQVLQPGWGHLGTLLSGTRHGASSPWAVFESLLLGGAPSYGPSYSAQLWTSH